MQESESKHSVENMTEIQLELSEEDYEYIKTASALRGISIDEFIQQALQKVIDKYEGKT